MKWTLGFMLLTAVSSSACAHSEDQWRRTVAERQELIEQIRQEAARIRALEGELAQKGVQYRPAEPGMLSEPTGPSFAVDDANRSGPGALPWVFTSLGAAAIAGSALTWSAASGKESELDEHCAQSLNVNGKRWCDGSYEDVRESGETLLVATYVLGIAGGVSAALGITLFAVGSGSSPTQLSAGCSGDGCGLSASGAF